MASSNTHGASSSTSPISPNYDVFLSFRGADTRKNFTDHLYTTMVRHGIQTFRDDEELEKGGHIASDLSRAIEESRIFIVIFSENYAYSTWCLNELVKITECARQKESMVLPIFYHVRPSDVRNQEGSFGNAFADHEKDEKKKEIIQKWRIALTNAANLSGHTVHDQYETKVVNEIINKIVGNLNCQPLNVGKNIVGISIHLEKLKSMMNTELNKVSVIGVCGPSGIGKTTIAKAIYNEISYQYNGSGFLRNIRERSKGDTLQLQKELLHGILKGKGSKINNIDEGVTMIKRCLNNKRVLVIFDDVDEVAQLEYLAEEKDWFDVKSAIIITCRDKQVLDQYGVDESYEVPPCNKEQAIELFSLWAFKQTFPKEAYKDLSDDIIEYANGNPSTLKVLGACLFGKEKQEWESTLPNLKTIPHMKINNVLRMSYDEVLNDIYKRIFLDAAFFGKREDKNSVSRIINDKCLAIISENIKDMHDLIQQLHGEIVHQECPEDPGRSKILDSDAKIVRQECPEDPGRSRILDSDAEIVRQECPEEIVHQECPEDPGRSRILDSDAEIVRQECPEDLGRSRILDFDAFDVPTRKMFLSSQMLTLVNCSNCRTPLQLPPGASSIRCTICLVITQVAQICLLSPPEPRYSSAYQHQYHVPMPPVPSPYGQMPPGQPAGVHGKKRAVVCGVLYRNSGRELKGSVNDAMRMKFLLRSRFNFPESSILVLTEEENDPDRKPTKYNIRRALYWLVQGCQQGDSLVFHFSGHGSQQRSYTGDEVDGFDETLCPMDYQTQGEILDDEINATIVRPIPPGVKLHAIIDACHSGTMLYLPFLCRMNRSGHYAWEDHRPPSGVWKGTSGGEVISFSGCDDHQIAIDTRALSGIALTGAMTFSFIQAIEHGHATTYGNMLNSMRSTIYNNDLGGYGGTPFPIMHSINSMSKQEPQLTTNIPFDVYMKPFSL